MCTVLRMLIVAAPWLTEPVGAAAQAPSRLPALEWLSGAWVSDRGSERLEEWWSAPVGNSMVGHFRWIRGGNLWITELLSITEEDGELYFRLRHFGADMTPWEARDDGFLYRLSESARGRVTFAIEQPRAGRPSRFIFESLPGDSLLVRLEGEHEGLATTQEYRYGRRVVRFAAQAPPAATAPSAPTPLGKLAPLVGRWTMASLPSGVNLVETCEWFVGERHVVCQMRSRSPQWQRGALTVFSYDPADSSYAMTAFGSGGQQSVARGRARGDTLVFEGELRTGTAQKRTRVTIVPRSDGFDLMEQEADGQGGWRPPGRARYIRVPE